MSPSDRGKLLWKLAALIEQNSEEFAEIESIDNGKPVGVARNFVTPTVITDNPCPQQAWFMIVSSQQLLAVGLSSTGQPWVCSRPAMQGCLRM
jgi:Aldehyde dehydrogenase family